MPLVKPAVYLLAAFLLLSCISLDSDSTEEQIDYIFDESLPRSILVLPPINMSMDIKARAAFLATSAFPLAESGYYVIPVALSEEMFRQNGVNIAEEAHAIRHERLREIFGADAALYMTITKYGVTYVVLDSIKEAEASADLVDLRNGLVLWSGHAKVVENSSTSGSDNIFSVLLGAVIEQITNTLFDASYYVGKKVNREMLSAENENGPPRGPYHPIYTSSISY